MAPGTSRRAVAALTLLLVGSVATYNVWVPRDRRVGPDRFRGSLVPLGPVLLALGIVLAILGLAAGSRKGPGKADDSPPWVLRAGLTLLLIGGVPVGLHAAALRLRQRAGVGHAGDRHFSPGRAAGVGRHGDRRLAQDARPS